MSREKQGNKSSVRRDDLKQEEKLIAVMLLDTYNEDFRPLSLKRAQCLLPLIGGKTMLARNVEFLIANKVEEVYLFGTFHAAQIKSFLSEERLKGWRAQGLFNHLCDINDYIRLNDYQRCVMLSK